VKQEIFEGNWEEIMQHASELAGQSVRLTILTAETANLPVEENLGKLLQKRVGQVHFQPSNLSERTGEAFPIYRIYGSQPFEVVP
jgi:hypothetical protein